jgi:hypothetical protein
VDSLDYPPHHGLAFRLPSTLAMSKLLSDPAVIGAIAVVITAVAALIQAKAASIKAEVAEKRAKHAEERTEEIQQQTSKLHTKVAVATEQMTAIKEKSHGQ